MEEKLKFGVLVSLKDLALRKMATLFWSNPNFFPSIWKLQIPVFHNRESADKYRETLQPIIKNEVSELKLPESLSKQVVDMAGAVFSEVVKWKVFFIRFIYDAKGKVRFLSTVKLCWNTVGVVDYRKTAEELLHYDLLSSVQRYKIACLLCLEDHIPLLWKELPEQNKKIFLNSKPDSPVLPFYWAQILGGQLSKLDNLLTTEDRLLTSLNQWVFEDSIKCSNKTAVEYFYQKLMFAEREVSLMRTARALLAELEKDPFEMERFSGVLCYLLSLMTLEQQVKLLKAHPVINLLSFSFWPRQDLFVENAELIWPFISPRGCENLVRQITKRIYSSSNCFPKFPDFFIRSPPSFKRYLLEPRAPQDPLVFVFLSTFIKYGYSESIETIFRSLDVADRLELVCHPSILSLIRWGDEESSCMLEVCLREATLTKEDRERWKGAFQKYLESQRMSLFSVKEELERPIAKRIFEFLDETDASTNTQKKARI